jgi:RNA polymerase-interacting CarD/CdnL/TRCF family regulator
MDGQKILGTKKMSISGGALPGNFKATFNLTIIDDLTAEQKNEEAMKSLVIEFQKCRGTLGKPNVSAETIKQWELEGTKTVNASALMEKKARAPRTPMTPEQHAEAILATGDQKKIDELIKKLMNGKK